MNTLVSCLIIRWCCTSPNALRIQGFFNLLRIISSVLCYFSFSAEINALFKNLKKNFVRKTVNIQLDSLQKHKTFPTGCMKTNPGRSSGGRKASSIGTAHSNAPLLYFLYSCNPPMSCMGKGLSHLVLLQHYFKYIFRKVISVSIEFFWTHRGNVCQACWIFYTLVMIPRALCWNKPTDFS